MRFWRSKKVKEHLMKDNISIRVREEVSLILQVTGSYTGKPSTVSPLHTNLQVVNFQRGKRACQPLYASCCTVLLYFSRYCTVRLKMFIFCVCFLWTYYLCEKYYKPITVWYNIADCISWVPRLTLLDLTNKLDLWTHSRSATRLRVGDSLYSRVSQLLDMRTHGRSVSGFYCCQN